MGFLANFFRGGKSGEMLCTKPLHRLTPVPLRRQAAFPLCSLPFQGRQEVVVIATLLAPLKGELSAKLTEGFLWHI